MLISNRTPRPAGPVLAAALLCVAAIAWPPGAGADVRLYEVSVPLKGTAAEDRAAGMAEALRAVAVRTSGRSEAAGLPAINGADPSKYVQRYSVADGPTLKVGFDGGAIERLLERAGLPLWPAERPSTLVSAAGVDVAALESAAQWRGLPIEWAGGGAVADASGARAVLEGVPSGTEFDWTFTHMGRSTTARGPPRSGIDLAADTLAARYAPASTRTSSSLTVRVAGMDDLARYSGTLAYLQGLSLVRDVAVESLERDVLTVRLVVRGDRELLGRIAALDGRLQPVAQQAEGAPATVDFVYQP